LAVYSDWRQNPNAAAAAATVDAVEAATPLLRLHREVDDRAAALPGHPRNVRIVRVQDRDTGARHRLDHHALHRGQVLQRVDLPQAQVVAGHVHHHGDVVALIAQALPQDPAPGHLEHREVHPRVLQHHPRALRA